MRRCLVAGGLFLGSLALSATASAGGPTSRYYAADTDGIFWFMHISDLHVDTSTSVPTDNLQFALGEAVDVIAPFAVFASGDLTDGSLLGIPTSGQDQGEWDLYKSAIADSNVTSSFYFDMPGNHDGYGDHGLSHYLSNSMQGQATGKLFSDTTYTTPLGDYYFVAMNSAGTFDTPFSFGNPSFTNVDDLTAGLDAHKSAQLVFVFAHHHLVPHGITDAQTKLGIGGADNPPSNVGDVVPLLESAGAFYLHGHVHQYKESMQGNIVTEQIGKFGSQPSVDRSSLDAWDQTKYESNIGVGIVDHNAFIYRTTDTTNPWPFVAITAPVDINLQGGGIPAGKDLGVSYDGDYLAYGAQKNPYAYDVCGDRKDNPVRALVVARDPVSSVTVSLDASAMGLLQPAASPQGIYTGTMDTTGVTPGVHAVTVTAVVGNAVRSDSIQINLTAGPCDALVDAGADAGADDAATDAAPGADAEVADADGQDAGTGDAGAEPATPDTSASTSSGCGCSTPGTSPTALGSLAWLGVLALLRRRRGSA